MALISCRTKLMVGVRIPKIISSTVFYSTTLCNTVNDQVTLAGEDEMAGYSHTAMWYAGCLQKATAMPPNDDCGRVLACFSLSCNPGTISLSCLTYYNYMESEKRSASSPPFKVPCK